MLFKLSPKLTRKKPCTYNQRTKISGKWDSYYKGPRAERKSATQLKWHRQGRWNGVRKMAEQNTVGFHYFTKGYRISFYFTHNGDNGVLK